MALPSDLMSTLEMSSVTNYRVSLVLPRVPAAPSMRYVSHKAFDRALIQASTDYKNEANFNIGGSALLGFVLGLRPSKDTFWTKRPELVRETDRPWSARQPPGGDCELHTLIATLSCGPFGIGDKAGETNSTLVLRAVRPDGLIIQPDRPATAVDAMLMPTALVHKRLGAGLPSRQAPKGMVWTTYARVGMASWLLVLAIDVNQPWALSEADFYPRVHATSGWVARRWHSEHVSTACNVGEAAVSSGCITGKVIRSDHDMPILHTTRPIMVRNDSHRFDLWQLAPVAANGWVLLGDLTRYVSVSLKRFQSVAFTASGITAIVSGAPGETLLLTALKPADYGEPVTPSATDDAPVVREWSVVVQSVSFGTDDSPQAIEFSANTITPFDAAASPSDIPIPAASPSDAPAPFSCQMRPPPTPLSVNSSSHATTDPSQPPLPPIDVPPFPSSEGSVAGSWFRRQACRGRLGNITQPRLCFTHIPKTGGTFIEHVLSPWLMTKTLMHKNVVREYGRSPCTLRFALIRDPFAFYVSLWSYMRNEHEHIKNPIAKPVRWLSHQCRNSSASNLVGGGSGDGGGSTSSGDGGGGSGDSRENLRFQQLFAGLPANTEFGLFVQLMLNDPERLRPFLWKYDAGFPDFHKISGGLGYLTYLYLTLALSPLPIHELGHRFARLNDSAFDAVHDALAAVDAVVRLESLQADMPPLLQACGFSTENVAKMVLALNSQRLKSSPHETPLSYYAGDKNSFGTVRRAERFILRRFYQSDAI